MPSIAQQILAVNGIDAATGEPLLPGVTLGQIAAAACRETFAAGEAEELRRWSSWLREDHLDTRYRIDPRNLAEAGWGVVFPQGREDELREALAPLLALRRSQAAGIAENRYRELTHRRGETKAQFLARYRVSPGPADPDLLPYYLLLLGSPEEASYRFQYQLDVQYAVGRLCFATAEEYARYAETVVAAERGALAADRRVSFFGVSNPDDPATESSLRSLVQPLAAHVSGRGDWPVETLFGPQATKAALAERLGGTRPPAFLFTASHGLGFQPDHPRQHECQGALLCQDWPGRNQWRGPISPDHYLSADDIPDAASPAGLVAFHFACYSAGTPARDSFVIDGEPRRLATESFVARLPQRLLGHPRGGALAVVGHVDRAWSYSFEWPQAREHLQVFVSALERLLDGYPIGAATEYFNQHYAELFTDLTEAREEARWGAQPDPLSLSELWTAAHDARSYIVLGDPAVRLAPGAKEP